MSTRRRMSRKQPKGGSTVTNKNPVHETYAAFYILTNLGIEPDDIFVQASHVLNGDPPGTYACVVARQGDRRCILNVALLDSYESGTRFLDEYGKFGETQPTADRGELTRIARGTDTWRRKADLIAALLLKGFVLREGPAN